MVAASVTVAYHTYGKLNQARDNVVVRLFIFSIFSDNRVRPVPGRSRPDGYRTEMQHYNELMLKRCASPQVVGHSLTSDSAVSDWWPELLGSGHGFSLNADEDFVICANYFGSPYGTTLTVRDPHGTGDGEARAEPSLPSHLGVVTIRDNVRAQKLLLDRLGVRHVQLVIGVRSVHAHLSIAFCAIAAETLADTMILAPPLTLRCVASSRAPWEDSWLWNGRRHTPTLSQARLCSARAPRKPPIFSYSVFMEEPEISSSDRSPHRRSPHRNLRPTYRLGHRRE